MDEVIICFLCLSNLTSSKSRINVRGRSAFAIEEEINKLPISTPIDDSARICPTCLRKLRRKKTIEENLQEAVRDLVKNHSQVVPVLAPLSLRDDNCISKLQLKPNDLVPFNPLLTSSPVKKREKKQNEPGVTVSKFALRPFSKKCF